MIPALQGIVHSDKGFFLIFFFCVKIIEGTLVTWKGKYFIRTERLHDYAWRRQSWA